MKNIMMILLILLVEYIGYDILGWIGINGTFRITYLLSIGIVMIMLMI